MGWTCMAKPADVKATLDSNLTWEGDLTSNRVLRGAFVGMTYYAAVETTRKGDGTKFVWAAVALIRYHPTRWRGGVEMCVKEMDEGMGPTESKCPKTILDMLSPLDDNQDRNGWARAWRKRCAEHHATMSRKVDEKDVIAWAVSHGRHPSIFVGMCAGLRRRWFNAYRKHLARKESATA